MRIDFKSGLETGIGAAGAGIARNVVTQHPANPVPMTNWYIDAAVLGSGLLAQFLGMQLRSRDLHELGEGLLAPGIAYTAADVTQKVRNMLAANAAPTSSGGGTAANFAFAPRAAAPAFAGGGFPTDY